MESLSIIIVNRVKDRVFLQGIFKDLFRLHKNWIPYFVVEKFSL